MATDLTQLFGGQAPYVKTGRRAARRRMLEKLRNGACVAGLCLAIGAGACVHSITPPAPVQSPAVVTGPRAPITKVPHAHVRGYLIYRVARWSLRRGW